MAYGIGYLLAESGLFVYGYTMPESIVVVNACVAVEQFGYGFGFTAYTMYLMLFAEGEYKTSHYAISTGFMALGMMLPGMASDGYRSRSVTNISLSG